MGSYVETWILVQCKGTFFPVPMKLVCFALYCFWTTDVTKYSCHRIKGTLIYGSSVIWGQVSGDKSPCMLFLSVKWDSTSDEGDFFSEGGLLLYSVQQSKAISTQ